MLPARWLNATQEMQEISLACLGAELICTCSACSAMFSLAELAVPFHDTIAWIYVTMNDAWWRLTTRDWSRIDHFRCLSSRSSIIRNPTHRHPPSTHYHDLPASIQEAEA
jgi:hypothetical protein